MKRGILIASWFVALILGWALRGLNLPSDSQPSSKTTSIQPTKSSQKISRASGRPSYSYPETGRPDSLGSVQIVKEALASGKLDPEELITLTTQILEISDPIERREGVYEITRSLSSGDQVVAVAKAFTELTRTTGRVHNREWSDFLFSSGRLLGADAINKLTAFENRPGFRTKVAFGGWASSDPAAALQWVEDNKDSLQGDRYESYQSLVVSNAATAGIAKAEQMLRSMPPEVQVSATRGFVSGLIQAQGINGSLNYYETFPAEEQGNTALSTATRDAILYRIERAALYRNGVEDYATQAARLHQVQPFEVSELSDMTRGLRGAAGESLTNRLDFIEAASQFASLSQDEVSELITNGGISEAISSEAENFSKWIDQHQDSGIYDSLVSFASANENQ